MARNALSLRLKENPLRHQLLSHGFFRQVQVEPIGRVQAAQFVGQWWHPLHNFPSFLAQCVAVLPDIESKSAIARILSQETGEGDPRRAHEVIYLETMERAGLAREDVLSAAPFPETVALVAGYRSAPAERFGALGAVFATEVADLAMVSGIGAAVRRATGANDLEWVEIHVQQEPDHVREADHAIPQSFDGDEAWRIVLSAEDMWRNWIGFFDRLQCEAFRGSRTAAGERLATVGAA